MACRRSSVIAVLIFTVALSASAKKKPPFPADILQARTVFVVIDPNAGIDVEDPNVNRQARADVERAFTRWGRLQPVADESLADLIVVVRKGHGKLADGSIGGTPINTPPPIGAQSTGSGINAGGSNRGPRFPDSSADASGAPDMIGQQYPRGPSPQAEIGAAQDMFVVYRSHVADPMEKPPVWRYTAKDALESPSVPAVEVFRSLIDQSEKLLANKP